MTWYHLPTFHAPPTLSKFYVESRNKVLETNKVHFSAAVIGGSICIAIALDPFHAPLTLSKFYVKSRIKVHISAAAMPVGMKPCIDYSSSKHHDPFFA